MSDTGIQNPLGVNVVASTLLNEGLSINPVAQRMIGSSKTNDYYTPGSIINDTCLSWVTQAIHSAYYTNNFIGSDFTADVEVIADVTALSTEIGVLTIKKVVRGSIIPRLSTTASSVYIEVPSWQMVGAVQFIITSLGNTDWARVDTRGFPQYETDIGKFLYQIVDNPPGPYAGYQTDFTPLGAISNEPGSVFQVVTIPGTVPGFNSASVNQRQLKRLDYSVGSTIIANGGGLREFTIPGTGRSVTMSFIVGNLISGDGITPGSQWMLYYEGFAGPTNYVVYDESQPGVNIDEYLNLTDVTVKFNHTTTLYQNSHINNDTYNNLLAMGQSRIPALSNSLPPTYLINDPSNVWEGQATSGYAFAGDTGPGQDATWFPYDLSNPNYSVTQWGFLRCLALQAWNVFNWQGSSPLNEEPEYKNYATQFLNLDGFIEQSNKAIMALRNSVNFLEGTYSNMNDLITGDITGVSLSTQAFGQDLTNLGQALSLSSISKFGLPSVLLQTLQQNKAMTQSVILSLLTAGLSQNEINEIAANNITASTLQEQRIFGAFSIIIGKELVEILKTLGCKTKGLLRLSDLLNVKKMFPISYTSLTVPVYNTSPGPTNSKTYYLLFVDREINPQLLTEKIRQTVGTITPVEAPPPPVVVEPPTPVVTQILIENIEPPIVLPPPPTPDTPIPPAVQPPVLPVPVAPPSPSRPSGGGGSGCVALESFIPLVETEQKHNGREITKAWMLESGMKISLGTEELSIVDGSVIKTLNDYQPCVRISTADGIALVCSTTAPILTKEKGFIPATEVYGKRVAVMRNGVTWYDEVVNLEDVGMKFVRVIDAGNNSFWAGERPGSFILHHNVPINDNLDYDKK
jgi:hypothetical protein